MSKGAVDERNGRMQLTKQVAVYLHRSPHVAHRDAFFAGTGRHRRPDRPASGDVASGDTRLNESLTRPEARRAFADPAPSTFTPMIQSLE